MNIQSLPGIYTSLNFLSFLLMLSAFIAIKYENRKIHGSLMISALAASSLFIVLYLIYHFNTPEPKRFMGIGFIRYIYFSILIPHTILAAAIIPIIGVAVYHVIRKNYESHRRMARFALPLWMYVSITGIIIYFMLYVF